MFVFLFFLNSLSGTKSGHAGQVDVHAVAAELAAGTIAAADAAVFEAPLPPRRRAAVRYIFYGGAGGSRDLVPPPEAGRPKSVQQWAPGAVYDCNSKAPGL